MVERKEVEALVREIEEGCREHSCTPHDMSLDVEGDILLALCRAWLAVDGAPVGHADTATDYGGLMWTEIRGLIDDDIHAIDGQRVRIVKEGE